MAGKYDELSFGKAFNAARKEKGKGKTFTWKGKSYTTNYKEEVKKPKVKPKARDTSKKVGGTKAAVKTSLRPRARPGPPAGGKIETKSLTSGGRGDGAAEVRKRKTDIESPTSRQRRNNEVKAGTKTLADMRASGLKAPKLSPKGKAATAKIKGAVNEELAAMASRAKRYTKEQWNSMSRSRRIELGLPPSLKEVMKGSVIFKGQKKTRRGTR
jgi:hypothetical protein